MDRVYLTIELGSRELASRLIQSNGYSSLYDFDNHLIHVQLNWIHNSEFMELLFNIQSQI